LLNIEIKGVQFSNKGAELMLTAIVEQLDKALGDYQITLSPGRLLPYPKRAKLGAWQKLSLRRGQIDLTGVFAKFPNKLLNFFKRYGIVTERDIDIILDASGFAYGEQWGVKSLAHTAKEISRFNKQGKKYIFLPQAFGPFEQPKLIQLASQIFSQANLVFPRDDNSYQAVIGCHAKLNQCSHIIKSPDFTCLVEPEAFVEDNENHKIQSANQKKVCFIPNNKMVSSYNHKEASCDQAQYVDFFVQTGRFYHQQGWQVVLLNHEGVEDLQLCQQIAQQLSGDESIVIKNGLSATNIKAYIGSVDAVISSRFHGCVSALTQGIPCLATSWSHKYQMLFSEYGLAENVIDFKMTENLLINTLDAFNGSLARQKALSIEHAKIVKQQSRHMWQQVFSVLSSENIDNSKSSC